MRAPLLSIPRAGSQRGKVARTKRCHRVRMRRTLRVRKIVAPECGAEEK